MRFLKFIVLLIGPILLLAVSYNDRAQAFCISPPWNLSFGPCEEDDDHHESMTRGVLKVWFEESFVEEIVEGVRCRDITEHTDFWCSDYGNNWGKDEHGRWIESYHPKYHFDNCAFEKGMDNLFSSFEEIIRLIKENNENSAEKARQYFGFLLLHPAQDFYAHSNWIDLEAERLKTEGKEIKSHNFNIWYSSKEVLAAYRNGKLISGLYPSVEKPAIADYCNKGGQRISHDELNKDKEGSKGDKAFEQKYKISGFVVAYSLGVEETKAWWDVIKETICEEADKHEAKEMLKRFTGKDHSCDSEMGNIKRHSH